MAEEERDRGVGKFGENEDTERRDDCLSDLGVIGRPDVGGQSLK